ncbi:MAG: hypothetical protein WKH64_15930 [Chloroflexia bacterium]
MAGGTTPPAARFARWNGCRSGVGLPAADLAEGVATHWRYRRPDDAPDAEALDAYLVYTGVPPRR